MRTTALSRPPAGQRLALPFDGTAALAFSFSPAEAALRRRGNDLLLKFPDGAALELRDFFPCRGIPAVPVTLADGTVMDAGEFLAIFAPDIALQAASGLNGFSRTRQAGPGESLSGLAAEEEDVLFSADLRADASSYQNLTPVYQEVIFQDGEVTIGRSIYGNLFSLGRDTALHVHLDNAEGEMLDMDTLIARLPGRFPENEPIRAIAVTGGADNTVILDGARLSPPKGTAPLPGLGTTQFDRYAYRVGEAPLALYLETILKLSL